MVRLHFYHTTPTSRGVVLAGQQSDWPQDEADRLVADGVAVAIEFPKQAERLNDGHQIEVRRRNASKLATRAAED